MKTDIDSYSDVLILTIKNGNVILVPFLNNNEITFSSKNKYDNIYYLNYNETKSEDSYSNSFEEYNINNERKRNETFKFTSKLSFNWQNSIKKFKSIQFKKYNKLKKYYY